MKLSNLERPELREWMRANCDWPLITMLVISFSLVYAIPPWLIRKIPFYLSYSLWITNLIPGLAAYISTSNIRPTADTYFPIMILAAPLAAVLVFRAPSRKEYWFVSFWASPVKNSFRIIALGVLFYFGTWASLIDGGYGITSMSIQSSKLNLALFGPVHAGGGSFFALALIIRATISIFRKTTT